MGVVAELFSVVGVFLQSNGLCSLSEKNYANEVWLMETSTSIQKATQSTHRVSSSEHEELTLKSMHGLPGNTGLVLQLIHSVKRTETHTCTVWEKLRFGAFIEMDSHLNGFYSHTGKCISFCKFAQCLLTFYTYYFIIIICCWNTCTKNVWVSHKLLSILLTNRREDHWIRCGGGCDTCIYSWQTAAKTEYNTILNNWCFLLPFSHNESQPCDCLLVEFIK